MSDTDPRNQLTMLSTLSLLARPTWEDREWSCAQAVPACAG
ncbi:hypothetical protein ACTG9Q_03420 [Actinokineospora sp. 24-640]